MNKKQKIRNKKPNATPTTFNHTGCHALQLTTFNDLFGYGTVSSVVERCTHTAEVAGSIPAPSTNNLEVRRGK